MTRFILPGSDLRVPLDQRFSTGGARTPRGSRETLRGFAKKNRVMADKGITYQAKVHERTYKVTLTNKKILEKKNSRYYPNLPYLGTYSLKLFYTYNVPT
uniref:Uncharacterized protein n=1 Tax=Cacopsylla melanoneura TaxID=428564 RepID=A0A8D8WAJ0_9HEMI